MGVDVARLDLGNRRTSLIGYALGLAVYVLAVVALYPSFKGSSSLDDFVKNDKTAAALFGVTGSLGSAAGWLNGNIYANFYPLVMLILTIGYGAAALAGQDEDGTLALLVTLPRSRTAVALAKTAAMAAQAAVIAAAVAACVLVGRSFELTLPAGDVIGVSATVALLGLDFGLVAMAVGAWTGRRGTALGVASAIATASYLISSMAPVVSWLHPVRYVSLFYWSVGDDQLGSGVTAADLAVLLAVALAALAGTLAAFRRLDLH
jgi:beta-exotoxin I transport system permease protein